MQDGFILRVCARALAEPGSVHLVLLDELNRANVPKVLGDLLTTMEASKRAEWKVKEEYWDISACQPVTLPYSGRLFFMPDNVWLLGTMNTTDQSVAPLDAALRRRFWFHRLEPVVEEGRDYGSGENDARLVPTIRLVGAVNDALREAVGPDALLGHSYLYELGERLAVLGAGDDGAVAQAIAQQWQYVLLPQLIAMLKGTRSLDLLRKGGELRELLDAGPVPLTVKLKGKDLFEDAVVVEKKGADSKEKDAPAGGAEPLKPGDEGTE